MDTSYYNNILSFTKRSIIIQNRRGKQATAPYRPNNGTFSIVTYLYRYYRWGGRERF